MYFLNELNRVVRQDVIITNAGTTLDIRMKTNQLSGLHHEKNE